MGPFSKDNPAQLAVFDFDGTFISGQSGSLFTKYLFTRGYLNPLRVLRLGWWGARYVLHIPHDQDEPREVIFAALNEHTPEEIKQIMIAFHDDVLAKLYRPAALEEMRRCHERGCVTLLVTATFLDIAQRAAEYVGVDGLVATDMERDESGCYTGKVAGEVIAGPEKTRAVERWANEHIGSGCWVLSNAYGDHYTDAHLLDTAEFPLAVSPGRALKSVARKKNWPIADWR